MEKRLNRFWQRVNDYGNDETRDPFSHSGAYHRHFQGYAEQRVPRENGKGVRIERIYVADYYRYDESDGTWWLKKLLYAILFISAAGAVILSDSRPADINRIPAVGIAQILAFLPMIYLLYRLILQMTAPRQMTIGERDAVTAGFRKAALLCGVYLLAMAAAMPIEKRLVLGTLNRSDAIAIALTAVGGALTLVLFAMEKARKLTRVPNEAVAPTGANEIW